MEIEIGSYVEGAYWHFFFELFRKSDYKPLWQILDVSERIVSDPESIAGFARDYLETPTRRKSEKGFLHQSNLDDSKEAIRLSELDKLTTIFDRIIDHYGLETALELYRLADRAFLQAKGRFWSIWLELFSEDIEIYFPLTDYLDESGHDKVREIVNRQLAILKEKRIRIAEETLDDFPDGKIVHVENAIERNCAIKIWQEIDIVFNKAIKDEIRRWGFDNVDYLFTKKEWEAQCDGLVFKGEKFAAH